MTRFSNKIAIVTGAGRGIGAAVTQQLVRDGATVIAAGPGDSQYALAEELGDAVVPTRCDVSVEEDVDALFAMCRDRFGRVDLLLNNAGIAKSGHRLHETTIEHWDRSIDINLRGAFLVLRRALALMLDSGGGAIVNTGSIGGVHPALLTTPYGITKAAMVMMTKQVALEYAKDDIRINIICPGTVLTPMLDKGGAELIARKEAFTPMGKIASAEEVANLACFLLSDAAPSITGAAYTIAGGREAR